MALNSHWTMATGLNVLSASSGRMDSTYTVPLLDSKLLRLRYSWYYRIKVPLDLKSVRVHFAYWRIALTLEILCLFGRFLDEDDRCSPPVLLIPFSRLRGALNQKLT